MSAWRSNNLATKDPLQFTQNVLEVEIEEFKIAPSPQRSSIYEILGKPLVANLRKYLNKSGHYLSSNLKNRLFTHIL